MTPKRHAVGHGSEDEEEDGLLLAPTTREHLHEGTMACILTETLTKQFTGMQFEHVRMILPQVHLRKPCYDFSFL